MISGKQKKALEKITNRAWDSWNPEAVRAYFAYTDRGKQIEVSLEAQRDFKDLMFAHHWHSVDVEYWKQDFQSGLLFLSDFIGQGYSDNYVKHAFEIYKSVMFYIPRGTCPLLRWMLERGYLI